MNPPARPRGLAGTRAAYDPCPQCGGPRVRHLSPPRGGCTGTTCPRKVTSPAKAYGVPTLCECPLANDFTTPLEVG